MSFEPNPYIREANMAATLARIASALERLAATADLWADSSSTPTWDLSKPPPPNPGLRSDRFSRRQRRKARSA